MISTNWILDNKFCVIFDKEEFEIQPNNLKNLICYWCQTRIKYLALQPSLFIQFKFSAIHDFPDTDFYNRNYLIQVILME